MVNQVGLEKKLEYAHFKLDLDSVDFSILRNPFKKYDSIEDYPLIIKMMRDPKNFYFTLRYIFNLEVDQFQSVILQEIWDRPYPLIIASRGASKSFLLGLYALLRAVITQGAKVVIVSASFRQSKNVFDYIMGILNNAPILKDICQGAWRATFGQDVHTLYIGDSTIKAIPIGPSGEKVRGLRSTHLLVDERQSIPEEVYEVVIGGFGAVTMSPIENVKKMAKVDLLKEMNLWTPEHEKKLAAEDKPNQTVLSGTGSWGFTDFAKLWKRWKDIINSRGDSDKLTNILGNPPGPAFDYRDFSVIRLPHDLIPKGFMDAKHIEKAKNTIHIGRFQGEYGACIGPEVEVITECGLKKIVELNVGDMVLTHKNRFRKINKLTYRYCNELVHCIRSEGNNQDIIITQEHPIFQGGDWKKSSEISELYSCNLHELNGLNFIKLSSYTYNIAYTVTPHKDDIEYIYAIPSNKKNSIYNNKFNTRCIPNLINLDRNFGIIVGYYLSEGNIGANGKATEFALDGHMTENLQFYITELSEAIFKVFGRYPKIENRTDNTARVYINNRIIADLFKKICSGISDTKFVDPSILYSNSEFIRGVLTGYWHGDGSFTFNKRKENGTIRSIVKATCINKNLLAQLKSCFSYFNIKTSLLNSKEEGITIFRGKEYNSKSTYTLYVSSLYHDKFSQLLSNAQFEIDRQNFINYEIKSKELIPYDGLVYNLEVDEDNSYSLINATVHNCFPMDSDGFYKRSLIESCTTKEEIYLPSGPVKFRAVTNGDRHRKYVYGIDPASESDNFAIVIIELHSDHRRVVNCWTATRKKNIDRGKNEGETDFYQFIAKKIRSLMKIFPCEHIALDSQGGGIAIMEALHNLKALEDGELPIWPLLEDHPLFFEGSKNYGYDDEAGLHIIEMVSFSKTEYVVEANHGMKKDMEDKVLLFPSFNALDLGLSELEDKSSGRKVDTQEEVVVEIEELKEELSTISHMTTQTGKDKWDTPETILVGNKKGRLRKDRYSALLMANMAARRINRPTTIHYQENPPGGSAYHLAQNPPPTKDNRFYVGPDWYVNNPAVNFNNWGTGPFRASSR